MKKYILLYFNVLLAFVFVLSFTITAQGQNITVSSLLGFSVDTIVQRHLAGEGVLLSGSGGSDIFSPIQRAKFNGNLNVSYDQIGTFDRNGANFPFEKGLVMTTGKVNVAQGPNNTESASMTINPSFTDNDLSQYANGNPLCSSASLEYYFIASADTFSVNYIFASEEYPEYACTSYNDVFVLILEGIDPATAMMSTKNVAIIPNSVSTDYPNGIPVTINSVNAGPGAYGSSSQCTPSNTSGTFSQYYVSNPTGAQGIQYDGRTVQLSAGARILPCQTYSMKMAISNVGDNMYDSGLFIEEGSFYSPGVKLNCIWESEMGGDTLIQNCRDMDMVFSTNSVQNTTTAIIINTDGDAILGQDYQVITSYGDTLDPVYGVYDFLFQGDTMFNMHVCISPDADFVGTKTAILYVTTHGCDNWGPLFEDQFRECDTIVLHLRTASDSVRLRDTTYLADNVLEYIEVELESGTEPLLYEWIPASGIVHPDQRASECHITHSGEYLLVASDPWGCQRDTAHVWVYINGSDIPDRSAPQWKLYPNPAGDYLTIDFMEISNEVQAVELVDMSGNVLRNIKSIGNSLRISLSDLPGGVYSIRVSSSKGTTSRVFVKQ